MSLTLTLVIVGVFASIIFLSGWFFREIKYALVTKNALILLVLLFGLLMLATGILIGMTSSKVALKENEAPASSSTTEKNKAGIKHSPSQPQGADNAIDPKPSSEPSEPAEKK